MTKIFFQVYYSSSQQTLPNPTIFSIENLEEPTKFLDEVASKVIKLPWCMQKLIGNTRGN